MKVLILGDIHGGFPYDLNRRIEEEQPELVLQTGDFGWWADSETDLCVQINPGNAEVRWCDGNHEHHPTLVRLRQETGGKPQAYEVCPKVFYQERGSTFTLPDGRVVLFAGGAGSVDFAEREEGVDWFREEALTEEDLARFPDPATVKIDIVISHTAPTAFRWDKDMLADWLGVPLKGHDDSKWIRSKFEDPSCKVLDKVLERYSPNQWFFGHFHRFREGQYRGCKWKCLACPEYQGGRGRNWDWLSERPK